MKKHKKWLAAGLLVVLTLALTTTALACGGHHGGHGCHGSSKPACTVTACVYVDEDGDGVCDYFADHRACVDADGDGVCDWRCEGYVDADGDGFCDHCDRAHVREDCGRGHHGCRRW